MEAIDNFVSIDFSDGYGDGSGYGSGSSSGSGYGDGYGNGSGSGYGSGHGDGYGNGSGYGDGSCDGSGYGDGSCDGSGSGDGSGDGYGSGSGLKSLNGQKIHNIDTVETIIDSVKGNIAMGYIVNNDLTLTKCFIAKGENQFGHGSTLKEAISSLQSKVLKRTPIDKRIEMFKAEFDYSKNHSAQKLYDWHHILTGSCKFGRDHFIFEKGINLKKDKFTVKEFVELTKDYYNGDIIKRLI